MSSRAIGSSRSPVFEFVSPSIEAVMGFPPAAFYADPGLMERLVHPDDRHLLTLAPDRPEVAGGIVLRAAHADGHWAGSSSGARLSAIGRPDRRGRRRGPRCERTAGRAGVAGETQSSAPHVDRRERCAQCGRPARPSWSRRSAASLSRKGPTGTPGSATEDDKAGTVRPVTSAGYGPGIRGRAARDVAPDRAWVGAGGETSCAKVAPWSWRTSPPTRSYAPWRSTALALGYVSGAAIPCVTGVGLWHARHLQRRARRVRGRGDRSP